MREETYFYVISHCRERRCVSRTSAVRMLVTGFRRAVRGDASLPTLVHILLKARHWEKMESWGQTAAS